MSEPESREIELLAEVLGDRPGALAIAEVSGPASGEALLEQLRRRISLPIVPLSLGTPQELGSKVRDLRDQDCVAAPRGLDGASPFLDPSDEVQWWSEINVLREVLTGGRARLLLLLGPRSLQSLVSRAPDLEDWALRFSFPGLADLVPRSRIEWQERIGVHGDTRRLGRLRKRLHRARERDVPRAALLEDAVLPLLEELLHLGMAAEAQAVWNAEIGVPDCLGALPPIRQAQVHYYAALLADLHGRGEERLERARSMYRLTSELRRGWPEAIRVVHLHAVACTTLADCLQDRGDANAALELLEEALDLRLELVESDPRDPRRTRDVGVTRAKLGEALVDLGQPDAALEQFEGALAAARALRHLEPEDLDWQIEEGIARFQVGEALLRLGRLHEVPAQYGPGLSLLASVLDEDPASPSLLRHLSIAWGRFGDVLLRLGDEQAALDAYQQSSACAGRLVVLEPDSPAWRRDACVSRMREADALLELGRAEQAAERYQEALTTLEELHASDPENVEWSRDLALATSGLGDAAMLRGDVDLALERYRATAGMVASLRRRDPENPEWIRDQAITASKQATALRQAGRPTEACAEVGRARGLLESLLERNSRWAQVARDLEGVTRQASEFGCASIGTPAETAGLVREGGPPASSDSTR